MPLTESDCSTSISFKETGFFSKIMCDYLDKSEKLSSCYGNYPDIKGFENQINIKKNAFSESNRSILVNVLNKQYAATDVSKETIRNIQSLLQENTFTVTTGHQLNLFTGPLYFLYKIISTINLSEELSVQFPGNHFIPVYWMATEDHDFEEINYFNFKGNKIQWSSDQTGATGRFSTEGLEEVFRIFSEQLPLSENAIYLQKLFSEAYTKHTNLAEATRFIVNQLFATYGLVIIDADNPGLKSLFKPYVIKDLIESASYKTVSRTNSNLEAYYKIQVNPRKINLFYLIDNLRERIVFEKGIFKVYNTDLRFTKDEILQEVANYPGRFSPNVITRPLYQEVILPNLCYIGGGGELAYWMQLKSYFDAVNIPFPILLPRNSVQIINEKQFSKLERLSVSIQELFLKQQDLINRKITENSEIRFDFTNQKTVLKQQFSDLKAIASQTDVSFIGAVKAQEKKQLNGLLNLEKRLLRAEKRKQTDLAKRIIRIQNELFPNQSLEERERNFSEFYLGYGDDFIKTLKEKLNPLQLDFFVLVK